MSILKSAPEHDTFVDLDDNIKIKSVMDRIKVSENFTSTSNTAVLEIVNYPKFNGIKYSYNKVTVKEVSFDNGLNVQFEYNIEDTPEEMDPETFSENDMEEFHTFLGDVMMAFVTSKYGEGDNQ